MLNANQILGLVRSFPFETAPQSQVMDFMHAMARNEIAATERLRKIEESNELDGKAQSEALAARNESRYAAAGSESVLRSRFGLTRQQIARPGVPTI